jgi:tetratricopeptide (TPR) repeat protein
MKKIIICIFSLITVLLTACGDEFFENPRPQEPQWVNTTTFDQGLTYGYFYLVWSNNGITHELDFAASGAAQLLPETATGSHWNESYNRLFNQNFTQMNTLWNSLYRVITMSNQALEIDATGDGNPFGIDVTGSDYKDNYVRQVGEYYFLRGTAAFMLMRLFAPPYVLGGPNDGRYVPFTTKVPTSKEEIYSATLGSTAEIYAQAIVDLRQAKALLPDKYTSSMLPNYEVGRASKYTATAMLAKVLFAMGEYSEAEKELAFVIDAAENNDRFALEEPIQAFNKLDRLQTSKEVIWEYDTGIEAYDGTKGSYLYWGMIIDINFRDARGGGRGIGNMVKSGWNQFTLSYWALKTMGWMTDPDNGDYSLTQEALDDLRYQQLYYYLLGYKAGITATDPDYLIYESVDAHKAVATPQLYLNKCFR